MSSGVPIRLRGLLAAIESRNVRAWRAIILLSNGPGATAFTVMSRGASLRASTRVRWCTAALLAE